MNSIEPVHDNSPEPSFVRLFAALGVGVGLVAGLVSMTVSTPGLCLALSLTAMMFFGAVVLHEVGRLLADEAGDQ